jgi:mannose-6-phosphate isomerase-like protein (cupin superfamily)
MLAPFKIEGTRRRLADSGGGYETVHSSAGFEISVYVLIAPEPDRQQPHEGDEVYIVLEGAGTLEIAGESVSLSEGDAVSVPANTEHRFSAYEQLSVLVILERQR